ncbi:SDR family NAD(P)-dependent oxidoreductase [Homoserinibacter sp. YIM 151385]|uniref:SDR family NAD(P)-dependent oxidoreductase n=1 Tax=Homoserinibacter sp. YIM 151385 TaxID=2985506 RepID=UPI0022F0B7CD|nr:SDR family NAD(P)-dependent oxidoreductase [Homoserinibacter sp. YIM 151385]WBU37537.1 SDR family NAD(P)-dependent oxidoreductase [Homoserinibacter sp. YIM 151385]
MQLELDRKVVMITGAGRGIGRAIAETFMREGSIVVVTDVSEEAIAWAEPTRTAAGVAGSSLVCDVRSTASVRAAVDAVLQRHGRIDVLINNAGILGEGLIEDTDDETWNRVLDVNVTGTFRTCQAVMPAMKRQGGGRIINAASFAAIVPSVGSAAYAASKAAVVQFTRTLAGELGPWGITANAYAPGMIPTDINGFTERPDAEQSRLLDTLTLRRWGEPEEVCDLLCFLASDASRYITGTLLDVSGGKLATQLPQRAYEIAGRA